MENNVSEEMLKMQKKQYRLTFVLTVAIFALLASVIVCVFVLRPRVNNLLEKTDTMVSNITDISETLKDSDLAGMISNSEEGIATALEKIKEIDIESLNKAIEDLGSVVSPIASLFGGGN